MVFWSVAGRDQAQLEAQQESENWITSITLSFIKTLNDVA